MKTKTIVLYAAITAVLVLIFSTLWFSHKASKWEIAYNEANGKLKAALDAYNNFELKAEADKKKLLGDIEVLQKKADEAEAVINTLKGDKVTLQAKLDAEKAKTKLLPDNDLVFSLKRYIGNEIVLVGTGSFSLTRLGAESSLDLFRERDFHLARYEDEVLITKQQEIVIDATKKQRDDFRDALVLTQGELELCKKNVVLCLDAKKDLEKAFKWKKWSERGKGAFGGALLTFVVVQLLK